MRAPGCRGAAVCDALQRARHRPGPADCPGAVLEALRGGRHRARLRAQPGGEWAQPSLFGAVSKALGAEISPVTGSAELLRHAERVDLAADPGWLPGKLVEE
jgi:hypothetical protein